MATLELDGLDELNEAFRRMGEVPDSVKTEALNKMGNIAFARIRREGDSMGVRDPESDVHILDKMKLTKPKLTKEGGYADVTFSGTRQRGKTRERNAAIAFINEYGKRGQPARPFIGNAMNQAERAITEAGADVLGDWMEREFEK